MLPTVMALCRSWRRTECYQATDVLEQLKNIVQRSGELSFEETKRVVDRVTGVFGETMDTEIDVMAASQPIVPRTSRTSEIHQSDSRERSGLRVGTGRDGKNFL